MQIEISGLCLAADGKLNQAGSFPELTVDGLMALGKTWRGSPPALLLTGLERLEKTFGIRQNPGINEADLVN